MTHQIHTKQQLHCLPLAELKAIAIEIGAEPADKRSKASYAQAILDMTTIEIATDSPEVITNTPEIMTNSPKIGHNAPEIGHNAPEITNQELCLTTTGTRTLHELKEWCAIRYIDQTDDFGTLYRSILNSLAKFPNSPTQLDLSLGCIDRTIQENAHLAEAICTELGVTLMDLSLEYGDIVIPHGQDAYWVMVGANKIASLSTWGSEYVSSRSKMGGCDDPYTATLEVLEWMIGAGDIEIARAAVERDMEIKTMHFTDNEKAIFKGARDNQYQDCFENGFGTCAWVFAVIDESGLDPKVARGAIASLVKKGMVEISDWEGKGRADDMVLALTLEGLKAGNLVLMPEYV
jgi:hypothetical protein